MENQCQIVIPARLASTRLPEKLLRIVAGKSILQHTYESARRSRYGKDVIIAVDDQRLAEEVERFGAPFLMTSVDCPSGTDRIAEVADQIPEKDIFINVQGDEPEIEGLVIDQVAERLMNSPNADLATAGVPLRDVERLRDPSNVKIVMGDESQAIYFSRAVVPYHREGTSGEHLMGDPPIYWHHVGLYAYRRRFLHWFASHPPSILETTEKLEQLRAIEAGKRIVVAPIERAAPGIDTAADLAAFAKRIGCASSS